MPSCLRALFACACAVFVLPIADAAPATHMDPEFQVGAWIWSKVVADRQTCRLWTSFEVRADSRVDAAQLRITADNEFHLFLDGQDLGRRAEWRSLTDYDVTAVLRPGIHVIAIDAYNDYLEAGVTAGLHIEYADGAVFDLPSDETWRVVPDDERGWKTRKTAPDSWPHARIVQATYSGPTWVRSAPKILHQRVAPVVVRFWERGWFQMTLGVVCGAALLGCLLLLGKVAAQARGQAILHNERARIARDIHDDFGARLTKLVLVGELARNEAANGQPVQARFDQICAEGRSLLGAVDEVIWAVNSRRDTLRDFETYVCRYTETFLRAAGIRCRIDGDASLPDSPFDLSIRRNLFLSVKEALNNAVRHAAATEIELSIHLRDEKVAVTIADNGRGFDPSQTKSERNGLTNLRQRIAEIGGECRISSAPGAGCRVEFVTPLRRSRPPLLLWRRGVAARSAAAGS